MGNMTPVLTLLVILWPEPDVVFLQNGLIAPEALDAGLEPEGVVEMVADVSDLGMPKVQQMLGHLSPAIHVVDLDAHQVGMARIYQDNW